MSQQDTDAALAKEIGRAMENLKAKMTAAHEAGLTVYVHANDQFAPIVCAWGAHGKFMEQGDAVRGWLEEEMIEPHALAFTKNGQPRHPLYLKADLRPQPFRI